MPPHSGWSRQGSRPLHFAYVQFGGCDWLFFSGWMPVQTSLTGVNTDIAERMNNACGASNVPYQVMRIDFLRWISLIIRCSLDVELVGCVWHRTFCAKLYNADKKEGRFSSHIDTPSRAGEVWHKMDLCSDCWLHWFSRFYSFIYMQQENDTPETDIYHLLAIEFQIVM